MGEHKHNPTAIAAKNGELPPKPRKKSMDDATMRGLIHEYLCKTTPLGDIEREIRRGFYGGIH